jgi:hypothetical protein
LNIEAFCLLGLLRFPEQLELSLALLPEHRRTEAAAFLASVKSLAKAELIQRWSKIREDESATMRGNAYKQLGIQLDELSPTLRDWCASHLGDLHG